MNESWTDGRYRVYRVSKSTEWILYSAAFVLLVPQTLLCSHYFVLSSAMHAWASSTHRIPGPFTLTAFLSHPLTAGACLYSLFCVWWLVLRFPLISLRTIPLRIYGGILIGVIAVVLFAVSGTGYGLVEHTAQRIALNTYIFGGPLLMAITALFLMRGRDRHPLQRL